MILYGCETSHEYVESDSGGSSEPPYIVQFKTNLSQSQKRMVEERVRSIESEVPIFVVVMKKSNVDATHGSLIVHFLSFFFLLNYIFLYTMVFSILANHLLLHFFWKKFVITSYKLHFFETINYIEAASFNATNWFVSIVIYHRIVFPTLCL